jgi:hypothetical protein
MRTFLTAMLLTFVAVSAPIVAQATEPAGALLTDPVWKARPADDALWNFYPDGSMRRGINGFAVISCRVGENGDLDACQVYGENPKNGGFGAALLKVSKYMLLDRLSASGAPTAGRTIKIGASFQCSPFGSRVSSDAPTTLDIELVTVQQ